MQSDQPRTNTSEGRPRHAASKSAPHLPGETGVWLLVLVDLTVFSILFVVYLYYRGLNPSLFAQSEHALDDRIGFINTLLLLTSSWFVVNGVSAVRRQPRAENSLWFDGAIACGLGFAANKAFEYSTKIAEGITPLTNEFFMYYYVLTGLHLLHVLIGLGVLLFLRSNARSGVEKPGDRMLLEGGATYWHMVDLLWVVLFPLLYLMG